MIYVKSKPRGSGSTAKWHKIDERYPNFTAPKCALTVMLDWPRQTTEPPEDERHCLKCFPGWSNGTPGNPSSRAPGGPVGVILAAREWKAISVLISTGMVESPWAWSKEWPLDVHVDEVEGIVAKLGEQLGLR